MDSLLIRASQQYEKEVHDEVDEASVPGDVLMVEGSKAVQATRFGMPVTNKVLENVRKSGVPKKTQQSTRWAVNVWREWCKARKSTPFVEDLEREHPLHENFIDLSVESMCFWLPKW